ncbi:phosphatidylglycerol lysyltransferase domain-containing protein, partial [Propionibacterium freudenreichii]
RVDGQIVGLLYMVPWGKDGLSLDLMRRSPQAPNGVVESMVTGLVDWGRDNHLAHISLNFAVLRDIFQRGEQLGADPVTKVAYNVLMFLSRFLQLDSLYRSNVKYQPRWQPRYICYEPGSLIEVAVACLRAEAFLTLPSFGRRRRQSREWTELEATEQHARREAGVRDGQDEDGTASKDTRAVGKDLPGVDAAEAVTKGSRTPVGSKDEPQGDPAKAADGETGNGSGVGKAGDTAEGAKAAGKGDAAGRNPGASSSEDGSPSGSKAD